MSFQDTIKYEAINLTKETKVDAIIGTDESAYCANWTRCNMIDITIAQLYHELVATHAEAKLGSNQRIFRTVFYKGRRIHISVCDMLDVIEGKLAIATYAE